MFSPDKWFTNPSTGFYPHTIDQSLRFNDVTNHYLYHDISAGDRQKWTWSGWVKRGNLGTLQAIFSEGTSGSSFALYFTADDVLFAQERNSSSNRFVHKTEAVFRDVSAWYHILYAFDSTQSTEADRVNLYVNGVEQTLVQVSSNSIYPNLNLSSNMNFGAAHHIGYAATNAFSCFDGLLAEVHLIDGQQLTPSSFAETKDGIYVAIDASGLSHGTAGYHLTFSSSSFTDNGSDPDAFADQAGSNNFEAYNIQASDILPDSPTNNFATLNPLAYGTLGTLSEGNLTIATSTNNTGIHGTISIPSSGKWYWELHVDSYASDGGAYVGFGSNASLGFDEVAQSKGIFMSTYNQAVDVDGSTQSSPYNSQGNNSTSNGDIYSFALDVDNQKFYVAKNGTYRGSSDPSAGSGGLDVSTVFTNAVTELTVCLTRGGSYNETYSVNFGQDSKDVASANADQNGIGTFEYAVPTGFLALCTSNLPDITIGPGQDEQADDNFNTVLYTGNATARSITGVGFQADWLWFKNRNATQHHNLFDSVRGNDKLLYSTLTNPEATTTHLTSFDSDGFTIGTNTSVNGNTHGIVTWCWKAGGSASSNSDGSITSSVSANTAAGFSIVAYTGTGSNATVGHGLSSAAPEMIITKGRSTSGRSWAIYHSGIASDAETDYIFLNKTDDAVDSNIYWNDTAPTSSVFSVGTADNVNKSATTFIAYCFHSVAGYSAVGSYVGNGSSDGTFVFTGFRPAWIMQKKSSSSGNDWTIYDTTRDTFNVAEDLLRPNLSNSETDTESFDILSNGFKIRSTAGTFNSSGATFIYLAFAEAPFKFANAR